MISTITGLVAGARHVGSGPKHLTAIAVGMAELEKRNGSTAPAYVRDVLGLEQQQRLTFDRYTMVGEINQAAPARL